ncbi:hypothetical protein [Halalkalibacter krulwichiae]|uniref:YqzE-like protein n=1 Tax=Halalkalibacter krulwichiae TaxID=199441 RepID=A0A1X9M857_9BACI|nr:hypothetical protein [Halalkalibacter krulwichiae]ARK29619.1 hypothetical protein BkAM31D_06950 [Halalkalibacter krulwichiae]
MNMYELFINGQEVMQKIKEQQEGHQYTKIKRKRPRKWDLIMKDVFTLIKRDARWWKNIVK